MNNLKAEWQKEDSILPGLVFLCIGLCVGVTAAIQDHVRRSYLGPNKPVRIVIHVPVQVVPGEDLDPSAIIEKPADPDELAAFNDWMGQAEAIVAKTKDPEAKKIWEFLKERAMLATPVVGGSIRLHERPKREDWIAVLPFLERHKKTVWDWKKTFFYQHDSSVGYFSGGKDTPTRLMVLNGLKSLDPFTKGITVLHEGWHAEDMMTRDNPLSHKPGSYAFQHRELWVYEDRLTKLMGDPLFSKIMEEERKRDQPYSFDRRCTQGTVRNQLFQALGIKGDEDVSFVCQAMERLVWPSQVAY